MVRTDYKKIWGWVAIYKALVQSGMPAWEATNKVVKDEKLNSSERLCLIFNIPVTKK
jgi:hypothetical protein